MSKSKDKATKRKGEWVEGSVQEFLSLSDADMELIETRLAVSRLLKATRQKKKLTQAAVAAALHTSQSRLAKMESGDRLGACHRTDRSIIPIHVLDPLHPCDRFVIIARLTWHERPTRLIVEGMSAIEVIEQIRALPKEERAKVVRFVIENEDSWIPTEFREAMDDAAGGKMVDMERVMAGEKPPGVVAGVCYSIGSKRLLHRVKPDHVSLRIKD